MPYTVTYVDGGKGAHKYGTGVVTGIEIFTNCMQESLNEEHSRKLRYCLVDFTGTSEMRVTPGDIRRIVEVNRKLAVLTPDALVALIAPSSLPYALARLWHTLSDDLTWTSNVFHTRPDAIAWLCKEFQARAGSGAVLDDYPSLRQEL